MLQVFQHFPQDLDQAIAAGPLARAPRTPVRPLVRDLVLHTRHLGNVVPIANRLSFDDLLMRIHPAESRVRKLAEKTPASFIAFDLLVDSRGKLLVDMPLEKRKQQLEKLAKSLARKSRKTPTILFSPSTTDRRVAERWFRSAGAALDGIIAKRLDQPYVPGERAMLKIKPTRTADCVVGGFRYARHGKIVGSLLLGLYDEDGLLNHVGFTSSMSVAERERLTPKLEALVKPPGFTGQAPGGPSRWSTKRSTEWEPLAPKLVVEVRYDHFSGGRFRHGTKFMRWRPDRAPRQCTYLQMSGAGPNLQKLLA